AVRLLHFNSHVFFGNVDVIVSNIINAPAAGVVSTPTHLQTQLQFASGGAYFAAAPDFRFGGGAAFNVHLGANGYATNLNGSFSLANPTQFFETNGIRYRLPAATLNSSGLLANIEAWFPSGFGMSLSTNTRVMMPFAFRTNIVLGPNLAPTNATIVFTAAAYNTSRLYFAEETKPVIFGASQIEWRIPEGEFYIPPTDWLQYVRQAEDDYLASQRTNLVDQWSADRISNDGYYRNSYITATSPITVKPDTNGAALLDMTMSLAATEYRPHFPYLSRNAGGHIASLGGGLEIDDDLVNVNTSYLVVSNPVPLLYARDCGPETECSGSATIGPVTLSFTMPSTFNFTRDGGLMGFGTVPATNLTWGFIGNTNFAYRTSNVETGAYHIAGTFLRGDQSALPDFHRPAVVLLSGWGDETPVFSNLSPVERPGTSNYANGFANYPGLNFRSPAQGRSVIAGLDTGWYPLTARSKYYVRYGGVSGIHEAASFPANLSLYGYPFTFQSYRLSFLDSGNWESRTDGAVALAYPSGFNVEFERMKFLCRGSLDEARLPATIGTKHLAYWNTDLRPLSLQFKPSSTNLCDLTQRYLVLGVETKLPFIPQAFHAALAFKPNGNLASKATAVEGVDSRFPVPANLQLRGPGNSYFPFTTAAAGYFNNWEAPGRPEAGFYSLVGRVRVPFFQDVKTHLHVTPTGPNTAQIAIAGGWPAAPGAGQDRGWSIAGQNYFNNAGFDANHDAWPSGVAIGEYRNSPDETYRPRAQQNWINVAFFDYPLAWNSVLREFAGFTDARVVLPVIDVNSRLKQLTPGKVDFDFAQDINLQLPRIKVLDLANDALNEVNGPINSLSNAIRQELGAFFNTSGLTSGFRGLQSALRENADDFFRPVLQPALDPVVDSLYVSLSNALAVGKLNLLTNTPAIIAASSNGLQSAIMNLNGAAGQANTVMGRLNQTLTDVDNTLNLFTRVLEKDSGGNRHVVRAIIQKLAQDQGPALGLVANLGDTVVNGLLTDYEPTLAKIESELVQLRAQFNELRTQIGSASGDFTAAL
ncbi:MAG TPA: hypothetical protein VFZ59_26285, partial [Verrucomicrobiae bacterium]|nr:hypothetical protein [Verrucomicrobiae bacterium]